MIPAKIPPITQIIHVIPHAFVKKDMMKFTATTKKI